MLLARFDKNFLNVTATAARTQTTTNSDFTQFSKKNY
jgi:hypothetical protein